MTRKDYQTISIAIAEGIILSKSVNGNIDTNIHNPLINKIADALIIDNPRFDRDKFLRAIYGK